MVLPFKATPHNHCCVALNYFLENPLRYAGLSIKLNVCTRGR